MQFIKNLYANVRDFIARQIARVAHFTKNLLLTVSAKNKANQKVGFMDYVKVAAGGVLSIVSLVVLYGAIYWVAHLLALGAILVLSLVLPVVVASCLTILILSPAMMFLISDIAKSVNAMLIMFVIADAMESKLDNLEAFFKASDLNPI